MMDSDSLRSATPAVSAYTLEKSSRTSHINWLTYLVVILFGIGSWVAINGIWVEVPVLVGELPEKWALPAYLTVICQLANIGPLIYILGRKYCRNVFHERPAVYIAVSLGIIACLGLVFAWNHTTYIFGAQRSTALMLLTFLVAIVDCTSTVTFLPFMALLPEAYMTSLFIGENMSSLLPSFLALIQGSLNDVDDRNKTDNSSFLYFPESFENNSSIPSDDGLRFSQGSFFVLLTVMMCICLSAFTLLNFLPYFKKQHVRSYESLYYQSDMNTTQSEESLLHQDLNDVLHSYSYDQRSSCFCCKIDLRDATVNQYMSYKRVVIMLVIQAWINCLSNGVLSSVSAYACQPYGNIAYHLSK